MTEPLVIVVVPCFNEAARLDAKLVHQLLDEANCELLLVDDGSTDATPTLLRELAAGDSRISILTLPVNGGKAEAVRRGLQAAVERGATHTGYLDADFATSPTDYARIVRACITEERPVVLGSRVALLGHHIERSTLRHYTGRVYATCASRVLQLPVYDTQCGAKAFAATDTLRAAIADPFVGRWSFDVELLGRLALNGSDGFLEIPLDEWSDVGGSKLGLRASLQAAFELLSVRRALRDRRQR